MRNARREIWGDPADLVVRRSSLGHGIVAIIQTIQDTRHETPWFWGFLAMTALAFATGWRLRRVVKECNFVEAAIDEEDSRDAVAHRLDRFARAFAVLAGERPPEQEGPGPVPTEDQEFWTLSIDHVGEQISSELRQNAPGFVAYWRSNPDQLPPNHRLVPYADAFVAMSIKQPRHIAERLRAGHDEP